MCLRNKSLMEKVISSSDNAQDLKSSLRKIINFYQLGTSAIVSLDLDFKMQVGNYLFMNYWILK